MFDLSIIKMCLEYAQFSDYRIRDGINDVLKNVEADLADIGFDAAPATKNVISELETLITDIETVRAPKPRFDIDLNEPEGVKEVETEIEEVTKEVHTVNVDDELEEFERLTTKK